MTIIPLIVVIPVIAAAGLSALASHLGRPVAATVATVAALASAALCAILLVRLSTGLDVYWFGGWEPRAGIAVGVSFTPDAFGTGLATLVSVLMVAALVQMARYRDTDPPHLQSLMLLFLAGMLGFCLTGDLFNMFVFFELMSVAAFALAAYKVEEGEAIEGSVNFAVTNTIGSFIIVTGIALVYGRTGALNLAQIGHALSGHPADGLVIVALALLACGFLVKAAVVPFHFWLADAYAVAPTPVCLLFAGAMSELGIYAVGRIWFDAFAGAFEAHAPGLSTVLIVIGSVTAVVGALMAFLQDHLKRLLAFATIAYVGVFLIGLGLLTADGVAATGLYVVADGFGKAGLFGCVGILQQRGRAVSELRLAGKGRAMPFTGVLVVLGALSFAGLPPFGSFFAKSVLEDALVLHGYGWVIAVLVVATATVAAAVLRAAGRVFMGWGADEDAAPSAEDEPEPEEEGGPDRTPPLMFLPALFLIGASLAVGLIPGMVEAVEHAADRFVDGQAYGTAVLHGVAPPGIPPPPPYTAPASSYEWAGLTVGLAFALAAAALWGHRLRRGLRLPGELMLRALAPIRALHSGHVGDYVAWLVLGTATFGGAFALALR